MAHEIPDIDSLEYHPTSEKLVEALAARTQNPHKEYFRILVASFFGQISSAMHCAIQTPRGSEMPANVYAFSLAPSGFGKNYSLSIMKNEVMHQFWDNFQDFTMQEMARVNLPLLAQERAVRNGTDYQEELTSAQAEFKHTGPYENSFTGSSGPAIKQMRHHILMAKAGGLNLEIDEIGTNLIGNSEAIDVFLELFDTGYTQEKLTKNGQAGRRLQRVNGNCPTGMLCFGDPAKLLDGDKTEEAYRSILETGYARRPFFCYIDKTSKDFSRTPEEILHQMQNVAQSPYVTQLAGRLGKLADPVNMHRKLAIPEEVALLWISYTQMCNQRAAEFPTHESIRFKEMAHREHKTLKLAGVYAFIDGSPEITKEHLFYAIKLAEESGASFDRMMTKEKSHVRLARYLADVEGEVTEADLVTELAFYKGSSSQKQDLMTLAIAWGYQHNVLIKKRYVDEIVFYSGESLEETDLSNLIFSYSTDFAYKYLHQENVAWDSFHKLTQTAGLHWCSHHLTGSDQGKGHRNEENIVPGFNLLVLDVDEGVTLETAQLLLKDIKALYYTTKSHTPDHHRFRIVIPMNYRLTLDEDDYKQFMENVFEWLPFDVDRATGQRSRKWECFNGQHYYVDGELLDITPFIPKTRNNEKHLAAMKDLKSLSNLERWFINNTGNGNRSNQLIKYALALVDSGRDFDAVRVAVLDLNSKLKDKLAEEEIMSTIMVSAAKAIADKASAA